MGRLQLQRHVQPFRRCLACNGLVRAVDKERVEDTLLPKTKRYYHEFFRCEDCGKVYWKGSHYDRMVRLVERLTA